MALVRVYYGLALAEPTAQPAQPGNWLTVAAVDDSGRLLDVCEIPDDPAGYAALDALFAERAGGIAGVFIGADNEDHRVVQLLGAVGRPIALPDEELVLDYAERFADDESLEELNSTVSQQRAVGLARALQAGALIAYSQAAPRELMNLKPVLAAHAAMAAGRNAAAAALRELLREVYPAALRAYPDPASHVPMAVLEALPEPGLLSVGTANHGREAAVVSDLVAAGIGPQEHVQDAVTALRVAISETPRRTGLNRTLTAAMVESVGQAIASVRACDAAAAALVAALDEVTNEVITTNDRRAAGASRAAAALGARTAAAASRTGGAPPLGRRVAPASAPAAAHANLRAVKPSSGVPATHAPQSTPAGPARRDRAVPVPAAATPLPHVASTAPMPPTLAPPTVTPRIATPQPMATPTPLPTRLTRPAAPAAHGADAPPPPGLTPQRPTSAPPAHDQQVSAPPLPSRSMPGEPLPGRPMPGEPLPSRPMPGRAGSIPPPLPSRPVSTPSLRGRPIPAQPVSAQPMSAQPMSAQPMSAQPMSAQPMSAQPMSRQPVATPPRQAARAFRSGHAAPEQDGPYGYGHDFGTGLQPGVAETGPVPSSPAPGSRSTWPLSPPAANDDAARFEPPLQHGSSLPGRPLTPPPTYVPGETSGTGLGRVAPPWQSDDLPAEPSPLRLVEPAPIADRALRGSDARPTPPPLRLVEPGERPTTTEAAPMARPFQDGRPATPGASRPDPLDTGLPPAEADDGDLLIFAQARSAWFTGQFSEIDPANPIDVGWRAAEQAAEPKAGEPTVAGLPRRVPQANLVPGSPLPSQERPLRIVRDPAAMAAHTMGYFRGSRRGEEVRGYAVGGRPGREAATGWEFSRDDDWGAEPERENGFRSAAHR